MVSLLEPQSVEHGRGEVQGDGNGQLVPEIRPENTVFAIVCFEGPDRYSNAGGLGVRVTELVAELATLGYSTHLYFIGDPGAAPEESLQDGRLVYHRWCQWVSKYYPRGVYD